MAQVLTGNRQAHGQNSGNLLPDLESVVHLRELAEGENSQWFYDGRRKRVHQGFLKKGATVWSLLMLPTIEPNNVLQRYFIAHLQPFRTSIALIFCWGVRACGSSGGEIPGRPGATPKSIALHVTNFSTGIRAVQGRCSGSEIGTR